MKKNFFLFLIIFIVIVLFFVRNLLVREETSKKTINKNTTDIVSKPGVSILSHGNRKLPEIALTFDADMTPYMKEELRTGKIKSFYNKKIVDILEKEKIPATIFVTGMWTEEYPGIAKNLAQNTLFEIANHSYSHPGFKDACFNLPKVPFWGKEGEFKKSQDIIEKITGVKPALFRFPGGCYTDEDVKIANKHNLTVVDWDDASGDSFNNNLSSIVNKIKTNTQNGSIILFHFNGNKNAPYSAEALEQIIPFLKQKGFKFVKVSDLLAHLND